MQNIAKLQVYQQMTKNELAEKRFLLCQELEGVLTEMSIRGWCLPSGQHDSLLEKVDSLQKEIELINASLKDTDKLYLVDGYELSDTERELVNIILNIIGDNKEYTFSVYTLNRMINDIKKYSYRFEAYVDNENIILYFYDNTYHIILTDIPEHVYRSLDSEDDKFIPSFDPRQHLLNTLKNLEN
jgi:hypothetical protein